MSPCGCCGRLSHRDRQVAKRVRDPICRITVSIASALAEKNNRLLSFKDANWQRQPSQTAPVKVARRGDDDPSSAALGSETLQVVEILDVIEDEETIRRICRAHLIQEALNDSLRRDVLRCVDTDSQCKFLEVGNKLLTCGRVDPGD